MNEQPTIAYFSMEVGLLPEMPTYSGGLGVLAGDTLRASADLGLPLVGVTLLHRKGYFRQVLDEQGNQSAKAATWNPKDFLELLPQTVTIQIEGRSVLIRAWRFRIQGSTRRTVPVYFLDTQCAENDPFDQTLTDSLYGGDRRYRLCQEMVLGLGGFAMLEAQGHRRVRIYHMNEGHSALLTLALMDSVAKEHFDGELGDENG